MNERKRTKNKIETRIPVDKKEWEANCNTFAPEYYYDEVFTCCDCGENEIWTAKQQKWWYEEAGNYYAFAKRCRKCRAQIDALKEEQKRHMEEIANKEPHPNEEFFKKKHT